MRTRARPSSSRLDRRLRLDEDLDVGAPIVDDIDDLAVLDLVDLAHDLRQIDAFFLGDALPDAAEADDLREAERDADVHLLVVAFSDTDTDLALRFRHVTS